MKRKIFSLISMVIVLSILTTVLVACANIEDLDTARANLTRNKYEVNNLSLSKVVKDTLTDAKINNDGGVFSFNSDDNNINVTLIKFDDDETAKKASELIKEQIYTNEYMGRLNRIKDKADTDETKKSIEDIIKKSEYKVSGMWIVFGHKDAIRAIY